MLTEEEINALITTIGRVKVSDIHICICKEVHSGLRELVDAQRIIGSF